MRVLKFIFGSALVIFLLSAAVLLVFRESMLLLASSQMKGALKTLRQIERDPTSYYYKCREKGGDEDEAVPDIFQLKFSNDRDYQLEVICRQFPSDPIIVSQRQLPFMVNKTRGSSGLIWSKAESALGLEILGRKTLVQVKDEKMDVISFKPEFGLTPLASCQAYGYKCCQEEVSLGVGQQLHKITDCPRSCYNSCQSRPIILSFVSDPFYETKTRTVAIKSGAAVDFSYVIDPGDQDLKSAKIIFGDGQEYDFVDTTGRVNHKYFCSKSICNYEANIIASDNKNVDSVATQVSKIVVRVE